MRPLIWFGIAILLSSQAVAEPVEPVAVSVHLRYVMPMKVKSAKGLRSRSDRPSGRKNSLRSSPRTEVPDIAQFEQANGKGRSRLGDFIKNCINTPYSSKKLSDGFYISDAKPDDTLNGLPGVRVRVIVPSELFRDSFADWDGFEVIAALETDTATGNAAEPKARLWILTMNYRYRGRGGITLVGPKPSPDWDYSSLSDLDTTNGRLRKIQDGIKLEAEMTTLGGWQ